MYKLLIVFGVLFLAGCWGPQFEARSDFGEAPSTVTDTDTVTDTTGSSDTTGTTGTTSVTTTSSGTVTTSSTTGSAGAGGSTATSSTETTTGPGGAGGSGASICAPPATVPELSTPPAWAAYDEPHSKLCAGGAANGVVHCSGEPCAEFSMPASVTPWTDDGLTFRVAFEATAAQPFQMVHDCGNSAYTCDYVFQTREKVYFLELRETATGYAVKAFYLMDTDPAAAAVSMAPEATFATLPVPEECSGMNNPNVMITAFWNQYVEWVRALTWDCDGNLE